VLAPLLDGWDRLALPDCWIAAAAIAQTIWNRKYRLSPTHGISDVDLIYFDEHDLTEHAEYQHAARIRDAFSQV
jgi:hypothetical protein